MIEFRSVRKEFPDGTVAVEDFSFVLPSHQTTVLVGSSGCGKTTLLRMINRMVEPTSGQVLIDDVDVASQDKVQLRRNIGYVLQAAGLLPHRTVIDNVATVPVLKGDIYTTSPALVAEDLVVLTDPKNMISSQNVVPLVADSAYTDQLGETLNAVSAQLTTDDLIALRERVEGKEKASADVAAKDWLTEKGLL